MIFFLLIPIFSSTIDIFQDKMGNIYEGEVLEGKKHGKGVLKFRNGDIYTGQFFQDEAHGQGKYTWPNGEYFEGDYVHNV